MCNNKCSVCSLCTALASKKPSYGEMVDLLAEVEHEESNSIPNALFDRFSTLYPNMVLGKPSMFYDSQENCNTYQTIISRTK